MTKPKVKVNVKEALADIRGGMDDTALMEKYKLSAKGLASLFRKLLQAGELTEADLEQRLQLSRQSHAVELEDFPEPDYPKARVSANEVLKALRSGMLDVDIMEQFNLSAKGLQSLFRKLVERGLMDQAELDERKRALEWLEPEPEDKKKKAPAKEKIRVNVWEVVQDIRSGMDDPELMKKYGLSLSGLERLFTKLVDSGELKQWDLDKRMQASIRSHAVELAELPDLRLPTVKVTASKAIKAIKSGKSDAELMEEYSLSAQGLDHLFGKLLDRGLVTPSELHMRKNYFDWAELAYNPQEKQALKNEQNLKEEIQSRTSTAAGFKWLFYEYRSRIIGGAILATIGLVFAFLMLSDTGSKITRLLRPTPSAGVESAPPKHSGERDVEMFQSITKGPGAGVPAGGTDSSSVQDYKECLRRCDKDFSEHTEDEKTLRANCRMACVSKYSKRLKKIRELYNPKPESQ